MTGPETRDGGAHDPRILVPGQTESPISPESTPITMESLLADNHSLKAKRRRERFDQDQQDELQITIFRCSDSRYILTYRKGITISTIAAGGPKKQFKDIYNNDCTPGIIMLPHENCGGLGFKSVLEEFGLPEDPDEIEWYLHNYVPTSDPIIMAAMSAKNVSQVIPDKPVLAAVHKHDTGDILPLATYYRGKATFQTGIPDVFANFFNAQRNYISHLKSKYPNLAEIQSVQNPELLIITRDRRAPEVTLPTTTERPGSAFRILSSRPENGDLDKVDPEDADLIVAQSFYPFDHFSALNRILVLTESMDASKEIATKLMRRPWTRAFAAKPDTAVYTAKSTRGVIDHIEEFPLGQAA